jgi:asparagine synthase (glutamine-hydrolysing)
VLRALGGSFALSIVNRDGSALLATDRMGSRPIYYTVQGGRLAFGSALDALGAIPGITLQTSSQAIFDYLYFHMVPGPDTIYRDCVRLLPGTFLTWEAGAAHTASYWDMRFVEDAERPFPELKASFRSLLSECVADAVRNAGKVGAFLSGGTDSSTVVGMLAGLGAGPVQAYSIGFDARGYDEMAYARIAARYFGAEHHEHYLTPKDVVDAIALIARAHDQPFGNSSAVPTYYCARFAKDDGIQTLLAGDGGDELFGGNARYAIQYVYSLYEELPRVVRKGLIEPIAFLFPEDRPILGKPRRYIKTACLPMPARYDNYNMVERLGAGNMLTPEFAASVDQGRPAASMAETYWRQHAGSMINRMLGFDLKFTLADNDLPKVVQACKLAGVGVRFPLLDDALVAFSARLAPALKVRRTRLRYFFKEALRDFLAIEIIRKSKHGFGLPFGPWVLEHEPLRQIAFDSLAKLKTRRIIRADFIDRLSHRHLNEHANYYGTMVWVLMMLEQWFEAHAASAQGEPVHASALQRVA